MRIKPATLFVLCWMFIQLPAYATLTTSLDKTEISLNQPVQLAIISDQKQAVQNINLQALEHDFNIVGRSSSSELSNQNGVASSKSVLLFILMAKHAGDLTIPSLTVGSEQTRALQLKVTEASSAKPSTQQEDNTPKVLIETLWEHPDNAYVQSQLNLIIRIYHQGNLLEAALDEPRAENTLIKRIGSDLQGVSSREGIQYQTIERRYALFPQKSGALTIPPVALQVRIPDPGRQINRRLTFDPFSRGQRITLHSDPLSIDIIPPASDFTGATWLPADSVILARSGLPKGAIKRGDAINMQIDLSALGLTGAQLPEVQINGLGDQLKLYPDQPAFTDRTTDGETIEGHRVQTFVLIASKSGTLEIPRIELRWWDRNNDRQAVAHLPAVTIEVLTTKSTAEDTPVNTPEKGVQATQTRPENTTPPPNMLHAGAMSQIWKWVSWFSISGWLLSIAWFVYYRKQFRDKPDASSPPQQTTDLRPLLKQIKNAARENQAEQTWQALQAYNRARWAELPAHSSEDWAKRLECPDCGRAMAELESHLFHAHTSNTWSGERVRQVLVPELNTRVTKRSKTREEGVPTMYPLERRA